MMIRYPAGADGDFAYSAVRCADGAFFDFERAAFRPPGETPSPSAIAGPMALRDGTATARFDHARDDETYVFYIYNAGPGGPTGRIIATLTSDDAELAD